jgi:hypothetical protein
MAVRQLPNPLLTQRDGPQANTWIDLIYCLHYLPQELDQDCNAHRQVKNIVVFSFSKTVNIWCERRLKKSLSEKKNFKRINLVSKVKRKKSMNNRNNHFQRNYHHLHSMPQIIPPNKTSLLLSHHREHGVRNEACSEISGNTKTSRSDGGSRDLGSASIPNTWLPSLTLSSPSLPTSTHDFLINTAHTGALKRASTDAAHVLEHTF